METHLKIDKYPIEVDIPNIDQMSNDEYVMARRNGFGASDSSIILGVNPYQTKLDLIKSKIRTEITEEERAVGRKVAVRKGRELEPLIIDKASAALKVEVLKPSDMYVFKDYPWLKINYDGVTNTPDQYIPVEIKVVTRAGEKHYDFNKALYRESIGVWGTIPRQIERLETMSIEQRANYYGIPPYYYTQLNQEMMGFSAPYGYLCVLVESTWELIIFHVWADNALTNRLIVESGKLWQQVQSAKNSDSI